MGPSQMTGWPSLNSIASEDRAIPRHVDQDITARMRGPDIDQTDLLITDGECQLILEGSGRQGVLVNFLEVELGRAHGLIEKLSTFP